MWSVISVMTDSSSSYSSCSPTSETCSRKPGQVRVGLPRHDLGGDPRHLLQVLDPALRLDRAVLLELRQVARLLAGELHHARRARSVVQVRLERVHHLHEPGDGALRARGQRGDLVDPMGGVDHADALLARERLDRGDRRVADPALRHVDDAAERDDVLRVQQQPEVAQDVLDLLALVEPDAAEHPVRRADAHQHVLDHAALRVRSIEDRHVAVAEALALTEPLDLVDHEERLVVLVLGPVQDRELAVAGLGPQALRLAVHVVLDQRVRDAQDVLRGAVVLLHQEDRRVGIVALEVQDVLDRRAAPRVHALVGVADDADVAVPRRQHVHQLVLRAVRVLVLVDQDVAEPLLVVLQDLRVQLEQLDGLA